MNREYDFVYSDRKTISVSISGDKVTVRCPRRADPKRIESFLIEKSAWIEKHLSRNAAKLDENNDIISYNNILIKGGKRTLVLNVENKITPETVYAKSLKHVKKLFCDNFGAEFLERVASIAKTVALEPKSVTFKDYKSRWGCCNADNSVIFNYKLLMLPEPLQTYVIVHELCHIKHHNHSGYFHRLLEKCLPNAKALERELKNYDFITRLY